MKNIKFNHAIDKTKELIVIKKKVRNFILKAKYKEAYKFLLEANKIHKKSYYIASKLATLNAEDAYLLNENQKNKAFKEAAKKLRVLLYSTHGADYNIKARNMNEYYWFSQQHYKQFCLGVKQVEAKDKWGLYSQGVGAANHGYKLVLQGKIKLGIKWALKSQKAWEEFFKCCDKNYHDPWYWYAMALGIQGKDKEMHKALARSAKLSGKNLQTDLSFIKLNKQLDKIKSKLTLRH